MEQTQFNKAERFRALHNQSKAFVIANPWDIGSARILEGLGFNALATTSAGYAMSKGQFDGTFSRQETLNHVSQIVQTTTLPVSADLENGFGDSPETVSETIRMAAKIGLVGASIDDAKGNRQSPVYETSAAVERIIAAVEAARSLPFHFTLVARAENYLHGRPDFNDTLDRLHQYEACGADVLYAPGLNDLKLLQKVCSSLRRPVNVVAGLGKITHSVKEYSDIGVRRISLGSTLSRVAYGSMFRAAREIIDQGSFTQAMKLAASKDELKSFLQKSRTNR
jgi:2-methylisocitrate lyase-like PEP mutase family enzyme